MLNPRIWLHGGLLLGVVSVVKRFSTTDYRERLCSPVQAQVLAGDLKVVRPQFSHKTSIHLLVDARLEVSAH